MTSEEQNTLRLLLREEVNAAVYASEQRINERFDRLENRMERLESRVDRLDFTQRELVAEIVEMKVNISEITSVLNMATVVNNDLQASQRAIELKLEENLLALRRDMQQLAESVRTFTREITRMYLGTNARIDEHEARPLNETHPRRFSAA